ncbi:MAG: hypothetical protein J3R72DRAFT_529307 [Linnemannia gamsii]|nr:MAG: hypothetical protein J3R72DRAFT_529307 [Linnemannia gamsii]
MEESQSFRVAGTTTDIENIDVDNINGQNVIYWEDIELVFPGVQHIRNGSSAVKLLRDSNRTRIMPHCIRHYPGVVLDIVLSSAANHVHVDSPMATPPASNRADTSANPPGNPPTAAPIDAPAVASPTKPPAHPLASPRADTPADPPGDVPPINSPVDAPAKGPTNSQSGPTPPGEITDVLLANLPSSSAAKGSETRSLVVPVESVSSLAIAAESSADHSSTKSCQGFQSAIFHKLDALHDQGAMTLQIARKVLELSEEMKARLILIQSKTEAILNQQLGLAEYPIPRLFIVLPEEPTKYNPGNWFRTKFRLHFICECGKHTEPSNSKVPHHLHLAKHEGYLVREPTEFFKNYGPFLLLMLELIKFGTSVAGHVVPTLASLKVVELVDSAVGKSSAASSREFVDTEPRAAMSHQDLANYLSDVEGLEGVELRQLGSFLRTSEDENLLGNLYRMATSDGHIKWVCRDHYRAGYQEKHVQKLRDVMNLAQGVFDEQLGKVKITLRSSFAATEFYSAIIKAKGVLELIVELRWECSRSDLEALHDALKESRVPVLRLDLGQFGTSLGRTAFSKLRPTSRYKALYHITELGSMRMLHIVLPKDFVMLSSFHPKRPSHLRKLSFELVAGSFGASELEPLAEALKTNSTLTTLNLRGNSIGHNGAKALAEALKTNSTLTTLDLWNNSIGSDGAKALAEALKTNSTLTTLNLNRNSIGGDGAKALAEALKTNSTLTTLNLEYNKIGDDGAKALAEALKTNSTLTILSLEYNKIGDDGAKALAEALKTNSTLTTLDLRGNSIGSDGAKALAEALKTNSTLTTLDLRGNSIGSDGAKALAEALKTNSTLTILSLEYNKIGGDGAKALAEALKTNSTLTTLDLRGNSIGSDGAKALAEALKTNSTLTTLDLWYNSIGSDGTKALAEALKTNSTLTTLDLRGNSIGSDEAKAFIELSKTARCIMLR